MQPKTTQRAATAILGGLCALPLLAPAAELSAEFHGYIRAGAANNTESGTQQCFQLPGAAAKYRLGNECEQLSELDLRKDFVELADGSFITGEVMAILNNPYGKKNTFRISDGNGGYTRLAQGYVTWRNISWLNGGAFWGGRRYYKRNDVHINDFFYWNNSGTGVGVEDIGIGQGPMTLSYFFSRKDNVDQQPYVNKHDIQLGGIPVNAGGALNLGINVIAKASYPGAQSGWSLTAQHQQSDILGGNNTFALQYGKGPGIGLGGTGTYTLDKDVSRFRLVEAFDWQQGRLGGQATFVFQRDKAPHTASMDWLSLGARGVYSLSGPFKLALEIGHDRADTAAGHKAQLTKTTLAAIWAPDAPQWNQRPEVRLYYTHANWNRAAQTAASLASPGAALSTTGAFGLSRSGGNFGIQLEYWW